MGPTCSLHKLGKMTALLRYPSTSSGRATADSFRFCYQSLSNFLYQSFKKASLPAEALCEGWWRRWESNPCPHCKEPQALHAYSLTLLYATPQRHSLPHKMTCDTVLTTKPFNLIKQFYLFIIRMNSSDRHDKFIRQLKTRQ